MAAPPRVRCLVGLPWRHCILYRTSFKNGVLMFAAAPLVVTHHHLNLTGQNVLTLVSWALTLILLGVTVQMGRRERTPFYVLVVLATVGGAFAESLYDE